jgi:hypothetical protein
MSKSGNNQIKRCHRDMSEGRVGLISTMIILNAVPFQAFLSHMNHMNRGKGSLSNTKGMYPTRYPT